MSSLFRSLNHFAIKRENAFKETLINTLAENSQEIQYEVKQSGLDCLELCEATSTLCATLEAIFLHGLKDSFLWQTINAISGDVDRRPEPSFWSPIMIFLHKEVIEQINKLTQITSEIGQCRAWIRLSLNESLFSSYLGNIRKSSSSLSPYYKKYALLKDSEGLEMAEKIMQGIEAYVQFNLPVNSSLLNIWPDNSLQLSGLWTPSLKSFPISSGIDVAGSMPVDTVPIPTPQPLRTNEVFNESISNSPFSRSSNFPVTDLTPRENLDLFLQKVEEMDIIDEEDNAEGASKLDSSSQDKNLSTDGKKDKSKKKRKNSKEKIEKIEKNSDQAENNITAYLNDELPSPKELPSTQGNSLTNRMQTSWSSDINNTDLCSSRTLTNRSNTPTDDNSQTHFFQRSTSMTSSVNSLRSPLSDRCSYNALLKKHERNREVDWTEVWEKFLVQNTVSGLGMPNHSSDNNENDQGDTASTGSLNNSDFEFIPHFGLEKFNIVELQEMVEQLCKLPREPGLDAQGFLCKSCQHPLGIGYSNLHVCAFSGNYYCASCMDLEQVLIPARIIYNWDFRKYSVSKRSAIFLAEFRNQPFIDLKLLNPDIYNASEAMAELQSLRIRLNFIRAYLYTCCQSSFDKLQCQFFGKEYLYEHIHQYSISDLSMIQRGTLYHQLQKAYKAGEAHILRCSLCSVKGFICEVCNSPRVLYPFHIDTTFRCEECGAVFHPHCLNKQQPCPKCERKRRREDLPLLEAVESLGSEEKSEET